MNNIYYRDKITINNKERKFNLLDTPVPTYSTDVVIPVAKSAKSKILPKYLKKLPEPLKPTKYVPKSKPAAKPQAKPRVLSKRPVPLPRSTLPKSIDEKVQRLIGELTPYYQPEARRELQKLLGRPKKTQLTEKAEL